MGIVGVRKPVSGIEEKPAAYASVPKSTSRSTNAAFPPIFLSISFAVTDISLIKRSTVGRLLGDLFKQSFIHLFRSSLYWGLNHS